MSRIQASAELLAETLQGKNQDYAGDYDEFFNFRKSAEFGGVPVYKVFALELAKKMTRLENALRKMERGETMNHESYIDTLLDIAGYAVIWHAEESDRARPVKTDWNPAG